VDNPGRLTLLARALLLLSSYAPLFALLAVRFEPAWLWTSCVAFALLGLGSLLLLLRLDKRASPGPHRLVDVRSAGGEAAAYLAGYLLPLLTVATPTIRDVVAYAGFLVIAAAIYVHTSMIQVNPLLYLLGFRVLQVTDDRGFRSYLISRRTLLPGDTILATRFGNDVLIRRG
jgi:hypothetical protein